MKTTLRELKKIFNLTEWDKLKSNLGNNDLDTQVTILQVLESNGIQDAVKALKTQKYEDYCLFSAEVAESVLHIFEDDYTDDNRPRKCIEGIRLYHAGKITKDELVELRKDVRAASYATEAAYHAAIAACSCCS